MAARPILDWSLQTLVLGRLCADRPSSLSIMKLVADGESDAEIQRSLGLTEQQFEAEVDGIAVEFERLSRAFIGHTKLCDRASSKISEQADETLLIVAMHFRDGENHSAGEILKQIRSMTFAKLVEHFDGSLVEPFSALDRLPALLHGKTRIGDGDGDEEGDEADRGESDEFNVTE